MRAEAACGRRSEPPGELALQDRHHHLDVRGLGVQARNVGERLAARVQEGLRSLRPGDEIIVITWLDRARRDVLSVHPRGDASRFQEGVFSTRSPHRPNPIGLHQVEITAIDGARVRVRHIEAVDGTPILDVKPVLDQDVGRR